MKRKTPAQLGRLAAQLPGASPAKAKRLEQQLVDGFYGDDTLPSLPALVKAVFPAQQSAASWLKEPCAALKGKIPARLIKTKAGRAEVRGFLIGIGNGNFQ